MANIIPAILEKDINEVQKKLNQLDGIVELAQIDVADGKFVDNKLFDPAGLIDLISPISLEAHLMVSSPEEWLPYLNPAIFRRVYFHIEAVPDPGDLILKLKEMDIEPGIAIKLDTPLDKLVEYAEWVDSVLFMSIVPGFQGQEFHPEVLERIDEFINQFPEHLIAIDGGINENNILDAVKVGVDNISIGSKIFKGGKILENYNKLNNIIS
ncbi:MAG: hypothetical protein Q8P20_08650 [bacterium]|nr:hypothetical protein [bacterium]